MNTYPTCQIYKTACVFEETNIGRTIRNCHTQWKEHEDIRNEPEPVRHLRKTATIKKILKLLL